MLRLFNFPFRFRVVAAVNIFLFVFCILTVVLFKLISEKFMTIMWPLFPSIAVENVSLKDKITYLNFVNHVHCFYLESEADIDLVKAKIQSLLSAPSTRYEGMLYLEAFLQSSPTVYINNWGPIVIGCLSCIDVFIPRDLTLSILNQVVNNFSGNSFYSDPFKHFIPDIVPLLLKVEQSDKWFPAHCKSLVICMKGLPEILGPYEVDIEKFIMKNLDCSSIKSIEALAEIFAALPFCLVHLQKTKQEYKDVWFQMCIKTLNTLNNLMNNILKFSEDSTLIVDVESKPVFQIPIKVGSDDTSSWINLLSEVRVFSSLCHCIAFLISCTKSSPVSVPVDDLLQCLMRFFSTKSFAKNTDHLKKSSLFEIACPLMQKGVFVILESLISNVILIPHGSKFVSLLKKMIDPTHCMSTSKGSISQVRCSIWRLINVWLNEYGSKGMHAIVTDQTLVPEMIKDVLSEDSFKKNLQYNGSKRSSFNANHLNLLASTCFEALKALENIILVGDSAIEKRYIDMITASTVDAIQKVQQYADPHEQYPFPFAKEDCRKKLYSLLLASSVFANPTQIQYVRVAIRLFSIGIRDPSIKVKKVCNKAFKLCRYFINPRKTPPEMYKNRVSKQEEEKASTEVKEATIDVAWEARIEWSPALQNKAVSLQIENMYGVKDNRSLQHQEELLYTPDNRVNGRHHNPIPHHSDSAMADQSYAECQSSTFIMSEQQQSYIAPNITADERPCTSPVAEQDSNEQEEYAMELVEGGDEDGEEAYEGDEEGEAHQSTVSENGIEEEEEDGAEEEEVEEEESGNEELEDMDAAEMRNPQPADYYSRSELERPHKKQRVESPEETSEDEEDDEEEEEEEEDKQVNIESKIEEQKDELVTPTQDEEMQNKEASDTIEEETTEQHQTEEERNESPTLREMKDTFVLALQEETS